MIKHNQIPFKETVVLIITRVGKKYSHQVYIFLPCTRDWKHIHVHVLSCVLLFVTPWTVARQAPLLMGFSRQEYWSGPPFPSPGDLPNPGIKPVSPALAGKFFTTEPPEKPKEVYVSFINQHININLQPQKVNFEWSSYTTYR